MQQSKVFIAGNQVCMKRGLDTVRLQRYFEANHCERVSTPEDADILIALTCAFIDSYVQTATAMIESLKQHPGRLFVFGCLPAMNPNEQKQVFNGPILITRNFNQIDDLFPEFTVPWSAIPDANVPDVPVMTTFDPESPCPIYIRNAVTNKKAPGPFLRIGWGCNNHCSYCSHPVALGPFISKPFKVCVQEYRDLLSAGFKTVVFHANDPADYGLDIGLTYPDLLKELDEITDDASIRWTLADINPARLVRYVDSLMPLLCKGRVSHLSVPLQTGSPVLLRRMRRYSKVERVVEALQKIHDTAPNVHLTTHLIAGFPGETLEDIEMTVEMLRNCHCNRAMIFPFSANPGTDAGIMKPQLTKAEIEERQMILYNRLEILNIAVDRFR